MATTTQRRSAEERREEILGAALVEFAVYRPLVRRVGDVQKSYGEPRYVVYVIRHQGEVRWQELGDSAEIDARVGALREALSDPMRKDVERLARAVDLRSCSPFAPCSVRQSAC